jgi:N-acetylglucosamine kinase-like BadF-type ATPase
MAPRPAEFAYLALAGADRDADRARLKAWAQDRRLAKDIELVHDALPLLAAGTPAGWGVAVIAGTGSIVFGRSESGESTRAGGWGYLLGDEGSAYIIALQGLTAAARAADKRSPETRLLPRFLEKFQLQQPLDLIGAVYQGNVDRPTIASWSDIVFDEAAAGDAVAADIIERGAGEIAHAIAAVCRQLGFAGRPFPLALSGGLLTHYDSYREQVVALLKRRQLSPEPVGIVAEPVAGAVILAQRRVEQCN